MFTYYTLFQFFFNIFGKNYDIGLEEKLGIWTLHTPLP